MTNVRQLFGKHVPEVTQSIAEEPSSLGSRSLGTFRSNGQNTNNNTVIHELFEVMVSRQFAPSYKREFIREFMVESFVRVFNHSAFLREFSFQLWNGNQRTTEADEVTDS
jgi:hypothetical protein